MGRDTNAGRQFVNIACVVVQIYFRQTVDWIRRFRSFTCVALELTVFELLHAPSLESSRCREPSHFSNWPAVGYQLLRTGVGLP